MLILFLLAQTACAAPTTPIVVDTARFLSVEAETPRDTLYAHGDTLLLVVNRTRMKTVREGNLVKIEMSAPGKPLTSHSLCIKDDKAYLIEDGVISTYKFMPTESVLFIQPLIDSTKRMQAILARRPR